MAAIHKEIQKIEISPKTIFLTILMLIGFVFAWQLRTIFFLFFVAYIINAAFRPLVDWMQSKKIPRMLAIILVYLLAFGIIGIFLATIFTEAFAQLANLISQIPNIVFSIVNNLNNTLPQQFAFIDAEVIKENLRDVVNSLLKVDITLFTSGLSSAIGILGYAASATVLASMIIVLSVYLLARKQDVTSVFVKFVGDDARGKYAKLFKKIEIKLGMWLRAQLLLMLSAAVVIWIGLTVPVLFVPDYTLHNYALPIAMLVFLIEIIPGFGIAIGGVLSTLIALATGNVFLIIYTPLVFILTQQLEGMIIVPKVMKKAIGLDPVVTILAVLAGYTLFQVAGAVLIIPIIAVIQIIYDFKSEEINEDIKSKLN